MKKIAFRPIIILAVLAISVNLVIWLPYILGLREGLLTIFKNFDGPNYIIVAKTWYDKAIIAREFSLPTPLEYYPAHLPGFPITISLIGKVISYPWAMLVSTTLATALATVAFYLLVLKFKFSTNPFWLSCVFLVFPARWVAVKAVGSPEPLFLLAIIASFYFFKSAFDNKENNLLSPVKSVTLDLVLAGLAGAVAQITKSPGVLLFVGYLIYLGFLSIHQKNKVIFFAKKALPLTIIPLSILLVFWFYQIRTGDFLAYFHSGDNFHLVFPPFQSFISERSWLGDFWLEDMVWQYLIGGLAAVYLFKKKLYDLASFAVVFFGATLFVAHRDIARYSLPLVPFALIAFDEFIQKKEFKIALLIILPAIYLYSINFTGHNTAPVADWSPYL